MQVVRDAVSTHLLPQVPVGLDEALQALHQVLLVDGGVVHGQVLLLAEDVPAQDVEPAVAEG